MDQPLLHGDLSRSGATASSAVSLWAWLFKAHHTGRITRSVRRGTNGRSASLKLFLVAFLCSCTLFWWLTSYLYREVLKTPDPVHDWALQVSFVSAALFVLGYVFPVVRCSTGAVSNRMMDIVEEFSYAVTLILTAPVLVISVMCSIFLGGVAYGSAAAGVPFAAQAIFYPYLFFGLLFLGVVKNSPESKRRVVVVCVLMILPRTLIGLHYGRFFIAQAVVPIAFLAVAKGWIRLDKKQILGFVLLAVALIVIPAYFRGDKLSGNDAIVHYFAAGSNLKLFQDNTHLNLSGRCPPLLVSLTAKVVPYHAFGVCTIDYEGLRGVPATLERILTVNQVGSATDVGTGTGSNYMLELYLSGGMLALVLGSVLFGYCCKAMVWSLANRSIFTGIWAMCLARALFAPRGNLGYVFELIPGYMAATLLIVLLAMMLHAITDTRYRNSRLEES